MPESNSGTAPNQAVEAADGVRYTYRRFGTARPGALPLVFLQHFRGNLDNWDPALIDPLAAGREVILVDYAGVGGSTGTPATTVAETAAGVTAFLDALGVGRYDLFGFSLGGFVAQELALTVPHRVRRLVLAGTAPEGGRDFHHWTGAVAQAARRDEPTGEDLLTLFFGPSEANRARGGEFLGRIFARATDRDAPTDLATRDAQTAAISAWGVPDRSRLERLAALTHPVFVAGGALDVMTPVSNTHLLGGHLPNAHVFVDPDGGHGFLFERPAAFAAETEAFLSA
ncbi:MULTISPECIES: alpha/beta fold hydrolase [unclassified Streptomyces]|uniref:alpha/beta fold hydrolase n=2 Tax=Streptomyces TaxID=1883 RepID=UPI00381FB9F2